jgi:Cu-Zn family superoxide dismutase
MKLIACATASVLAFSAGLPAHAKQPVRAAAQITGCQNSEISGIASLQEERSDEGVKVVSISLLVRGLSDGPHAVHIHEAGSCAATATPCGAAGGHFDPGPNGNPSPDGNHPFHMGDLVNIEVKHGLGQLHTSTSRITLSPGPLSVFDANGSAFIIHVDPDTYCPNGPVPGCAGGGRAACGVIEPLD